MKIGVRNTRQEKDRRDRERQIDTTHRDRQIHTQANTETGESRLDRRKTDETVRELNLV